MRKICDIREVNSILYDILCYFDDFCKKNGIKYYLSNGTLLGAAKYNDFIPWDDDVDVLMPREDYDRLMKSTDVNNGKYRLLCEEQIPLWRLPYAKLSNEDTVVNEGDYDFGLSFGLSMDIFPIDKWHPYLLIAKAQSFECELLKRMLIATNGRSFFTNKRGIRRFVLYMIWCAGKMLGHQNISKGIKRKANKSKKYRSKYVGCVVWTCHTTHEVLCKSYFEKTASLMIRGREFPVFEGYKQYLDNLYGKWCEELPLEKRHSNHTIEVWWKNET